MAHLLDTRTRAERTPVAWLRHGVQIADFVNARARRSDIVAFIGEDAGAGHAACFYPSLAEIDLNRPVAFVKNVEPEWVGDVNRRSTLFDWPKAAGALIHEASHARWTTWDLQKGWDLTKKTGNAKLSTVIELFEESRIERMATLTWPEDRCFLRSSAMGIIMDDIDLDEIKTRDPFNVARLMLLTMARNDAQGLAEDYIRELRAVLVSVYGVILYEMFRNVWLEAQAIIVNHSMAFELMLPLAERWLELIPEPTEEQKAAAEAAAEELKKQLEELIENATASAEIGGQQDADEQQSDEITQEQLKEAAREQAEEKEAEDEASKIFAKSTAEISPRGTRSRVVERRDPSDDERAAAVILARELEKARYRDRIETVTSSRLPPGRLDTSAAIRGLAQRSQRRTVTAEPWRHVERKHVEDPNLTIGVAVDISGSMNPAMAAMATCAWVLSEAGHRIQADVAQVYYGNAVFPTLSPGQRMPKVIVRSAHDGTEEFDSAFKALDGKLHLLHGSGARVLVICSDTHYTAVQSPLFVRWTDRAVKAGVAVLVLTFDYGDSVARHRKLNPGVQVINGRMTPVETAKAIGQAAVKALAAAVAR